MQKEKTPKDTLRSVTSHVVTPIEHRATLQNLLEQFHQNALKFLIALCFSQYAFTLDLELLSLKTSFFFIAVATCVLQEYTCTHRAGASMTYTSGAL